MTYHAKEATSQEKGLKEAFLDVSVLSYFSDTASTRKFAASVRSKDIRSLRQLTSLTEDEAFRLAAVKPEYRQRVRSALQEVGLAFLDSPTQVKQHKQPRP